MKELAAFLCVLFLTLALQEASPGDSPVATERCEPSYVVLEDSPRLRASTSDRTTLALIGCREDLERLSAQDLSSAEEELLRMADASDWWGTATLASEELVVAGSRVSGLLKVAHPLKVFFNSTARRRGTATVRP
jgi:hypothetical protein